MLAKIERKYFMNILNDSNDTLLFTEFISFDFLVAYLAWRINFGYIRYMQWYQYVVVLALWVFNRLICHFFIEKQFCRKSLKSTFYKPNKLISTICTNAYFFFWNSIYKETILNWDQFKERQISLSASLHRGRKKNYTKEIIFCRLIQKSMMNLLNGKKMRNKSLTLINLLKFLK